MTDERTKAIELGHGGRMSVQRKRDAVLRQALLEFKELYNTEWLIERHGNKTPAQFRSEQMRMKKSAA